MKSTLEIEIPALASMGEGMVTIPFEGAIEQASVYVSPGSTMSGLMIGYARVCTPGNVEVKFMNMSSDMEEPMSMVPVSYTHLDVYKRQGSRARPG